MRRLCPLSPHVQWRPLVNFPYLFAATALVSSFLKGFLFRVCSSSRACRIFSLPFWLLFSPFINHTDRFQSTHYSPSFFRIWRMWNLAPVGNATQFPISHSPFFLSPRCRGVIEICVSDKFGFLCVKRMISAFSSTASTTYDRLHLQEVWPIRAWPANNGF